MSAILSPVWLLPLAVYGQPLVPISVAGPDKGTGMHETRKSQLASELARVFTHAELRCEYLIQHLMDDLPVSATEAALEPDEKLLNEFAAFIDDISFIELKAALRSVVLVMCQIRSDNQCARTNGIKHLANAKKRLEQCRQWLVCLADEDWQQQIRRSAGKTVLADGESWSLENGRPPAERDREGMEQDEADLFLR